MVEPRGAIALKVFTHFYYWYMYSSYYTLIIHLFEEKLFFGNCFSTFWFFNDRKQIDL